MRHWWNYGAKTGFLLWALLVACAPVKPPVEAGSCGPAFPANMTDEEAISALLDAESAGVVRQDVVALMQLWSPDGRIVDAGHTPANSADDQTWQGADAIRHRYLYRVFPGAPAPAQSPEREITFEEGAAVVTATTRIGTEISPGGDRWRVVKSGNCWVIQELVFNLEPS